MLLPIALAVCLISGYAHSTVLSDAVSLMPARSWRTFVAGGSANFLTGDANAIFGYSNNGVWDAHSGQLLFLGSPHWQPWNMIIWKDATNAWRNGPLPPGINSTVHSYDNVTIDPSSGILYFWPNAAPVWKYDPRTDAWGTISTGNNPQGAYGQAMEYFPERNSLFFSNGGYIAECRLQTMSWSSFTTLAGVGGLHTLIVYNPVHKVLIAGGGNGSSQMYKITASGAVTAFKPAPVEVGISTGLLTYCPVSGVMLYMTDRDFYEWNIETDVWTRLGGNPCNLSGSAQDGYHHGEIWVPVPAYGVNILVTACQFPFLIYKYASKASVEQASGPGQAVELAASPNPFNARTRISCNRKASAEIFDVRGKSVGRLALDNRGTLWNASGLGAGVYTAVVKSNSKQYVKKLFYMK